MRIARCAQRGQLCLRVDRAELRCVGHVGHARQHHVLIVDARLCAVLRGGGRNGGGGELAVCTGHGDHLVTGGFDRAGLVHVDVTGVGCDHGLPRAQERGRGEQVRLRAADEKVHVGIRTGKAGADGIGRAAAVIVEPVAGGGVEIRVAQGAQHVRVCTLGIVILEAEHGALLSSVWVRHAARAAAVMISPAARDCQCMAPLFPPRMKSGFFLSKDRGKCFPQLLCFAL